MFSSSCFLTCQDEFIKFLHPLKYENNETRVEGRLGDKNIHYSSVVGMCYRSSNLINIYTLYPLS